MKRCPRGHRRRLVLVLLLLPLLLPTMGFVPGMQTDSDKARQAASSAPEVEDIFWRPTVDSSAEYDPASDSWRVTLTENVSQTEVAQLTVDDDTRKVERVEISPEADTLTYPNTSEFLAATFAIKLAAGIPAGQEEAGEAILTGYVPYRDFLIEYPPGSLPAFVPPALFATSHEEYGTFFAAEMVLVLAAALVLTAYAARSLGRWWPFPVAVFAAGALLLKPVALARYDPIVALSLAAAVALTSTLELDRSRSRPRTKAVLVAAWASLGFGAAAKLIPALAILPLALLAAREENARTLKEAARVSARGFVVFLGVVAAFFLPALLLGGGGLVQSFAYHTDRGLQVESLGASVLMRLGYLEGTVLEYGSVDVQGQAAEFLSSMSLPATMILLAVTALVMYREHRGGRFGPEQFPRFAAAFVLAFMLGSKVLSPQYMIWLLPLLPLSAGGIWGLVVSAVFLASCWMSTYVYPYHWDELLIDGQFSPLTNDVLLARNLLLVVLWALMLFLPAASNPLGKLAEKPAAQRKREPS